MPGLGRGLDALLSDSRKAHEQRQQETQEHTVAVSETASEGLSMFTGQDVQTGSEDGSSGERILSISADALTASKYQPRKNFDDESIQELADSIKEHGLLEPLLVRNADEEGKYEIICGERRYRACKLAGLNEIPCLVRDILENKAYAVALIENIQREDLNPLEQAGALQLMLDECSLTQDELAKTLGKSRSSIANLLRLNNLAPEVKEMLSDGTLDLGHAKVILSLDTGLQAKTAAYVVKKDLTVRQTEAFVKEIKEKDPDDGGDKPEKPARSENFAVWENALCEKLSGIKVKFSGSDSGKGKLTLAYKSEDELAQLLSVLGIAAQNG